MHTTPRKKWKKTGGWCRPPRLEFSRFCRVSFVFSSQTGRLLYLPHAVSSFLGFSGRPSRIKPWNPWNLQAPLFGFLRQAAPSQTLEPLEPAGTLAEMLSYTHIYFLFVSFLFFIIHVETTTNTRNANFLHIQTVPSVLRTARRLDSRLSIFNFPPDAWSPFRCGVQRPFHSLIWEHVEGSA